MIFFNDLKVTKQSNNLWALDQEFRFSHDRINYIVPKGFHTDLATIPFPVSIILPPDGDYKESAVVHDFLLARMYSKSIEMTRNKASLAFLQGLIYQSIPIYKIITLMVGVKFLDIGRFIQKELLK